MSNWVKQIRQRKRNIICSLLYEESRKKLYKCSYCIWKLKFYHWQQSLSSLLKWQAHYNPMKMTDKNPSLNNHSLPDILLSKNGFPQTSSVHNSNNHTSAFLWDSCCALVYSKRILYIRPIFSHRILKRRILKGQGFIKLVIFITSSRTPLSKLALL